MENNPFYLVALNTLIAFIFLFPIVAFCMDFVLGAHAVQESNEHKWKMLACKLALYQVQMTVSLNAMRRAMDDHMIDCSPVLERPEFRGRLWTDLRSRAETSALLVVDRLMKVAGDER